jgi:hypothetical protein
MRRYLQLAAIILLLITGAAATRADLFKHKEKKPHENVEWLWQYGPPPAEGRENALVLDPHFRPFLAQYLTAPKTFWSQTGRQPKSLAETALDFLSVPGKVLAEQDRYLSITGCVIRFCADRGLLWVDFGLPHPLVVFAAINWIQQNKTPDQPGAEYTLWVFSNKALDPDHIPAALTHSVARWTAEPPLGSTILQTITAAILVDPDGKPHQIKPAVIGANTITEPQTETKAKS